MCPAGEVSVLQTTRFVTMKTAHKQSDEKQAVTFHITQELS